MEKDANLTSSHPSKGGKSHNHAGLTPSGEKFPMYIGIFAEGDISKETTTLCLEVLELAKAAFPEDLQIVKDIDKITAKSKRDWALTPEPHITTLYLGHKPPTSATTQEIYSKFSPGIKIPFDVHAVAYLPGQILTGVTKLDRTAVFCDNEYDHMTLMTGTLTAKYSNDLLIQIFQNIDYLKEREGLFGGVTPGRVVKVEVNVQKKKQHAYLIKPLQPLHVYAIANKKY